MNAIEGFVSSDVIRTFSAFLKFCYIARRNVITERSLEDLGEALKRFHQHRVVFSGPVRAEGLAGFSLPRQHSLVHYNNNIKNFGSPNGLCSSITESKHIVAVKRPWRRSSHYKALPQILKVNERLDKLAAARADFTARGMLSNPPLTTAILDALGDGQDSDNGSGGNNDNGGDHNNNSNNNDNNSDDNNNNSDNNNNDDDNDNNDDDEDNDNDAGPVESEPLMNEVRLAQEKGNHCLFPTFQSLKLFD